MRRGYADTPEGQVHYVEDGEGETVLLLHQVALSSRQFADILPIVGKKYRAIAVDALGYGASDRIPPGWRIEDYARNVVSFLDNLKVARAQIFGHLMGASIAVEIAAAYPSRVGRLILSACVNADAETRRAKLEYYAHKQMAIRQDGSHLMEFWRERMARGHMDPVICQRALVEYLASDLGRTAEEGHRILFAYDLASRLPLVKHSTLLLYGSGDSFLARLDATRTLLPNCQTRVIPNTHVYPAWERPVDYAHAILDFLSATGI